MTATKKQPNPGGVKVKTALKEVGRAEAAYEKCVARERKAIAQYAAAKSRAKGSSLDRLTKSARVAKQRANESTALRREAAAKLKEARKLLREQEQVTREAERKERARERALAAFLRKWERQYDAEMKRKKQNIRLRKKEIRTGSG